jgi:hypothetical protein
MITLCLGGPLDGKLTADERSFFDWRVPIDAEHYRSEGYRREMFGWATDWMFVYLHTSMSPDQALNLLGFGPTVGAEPR